jgi:hypothetical protein
MLSHSAWLENWVLSAAETSHLSMTQEGRLDNRNALYDGKALRQELPHKEIATAVWSAWEKVKLPGGVLPGPHSESEK